MNTLPKRKPNRLPSYDYASDGCYFITICTREYRQILSRITGTPETGCRTELTECGRVVEQAILSVPEHYDGVSVSQYVIMPNHIHLMLCLTGGRMISAPTAGGRMISAPAEGGRMVSAPTVVGSMKRHVSKTLGASIWQKGFHDHVIRNEADYRLHLQYMEENPVKWQMGKDDYYA